MEWERQNGGGFEVRRVDKVFGRRIGDIKGAATWGDMHKAIVAFIEDEIAEVV